MRTSLYKGKRKDNGEWVEGSLYSEPNEEWAAIMPVVSVYTVYPGTVGQ